MKSILAFALASVMASNIIMAQERKTFVLDDLIPGGSSYNRMQPKEAYYAWWGESLLRLEIAHVDNLFSLDDINAVLQAGGRNRIHDLRYSEFPYPDKPIVRFYANNEFICIDWEKHKIVSAVSLDRSNDLDSDFIGFEPNTGNIAYSSGYNLYVSTPEGEVIPVTTDGSMDVIYGESVHRNEFGIDRGIFWSPSGKALAFYRMDQSMVSSYPQVNIEGGEQGRCAVVVPDKYPMAGEMSHKVTVGVFDLKSRKTVYLDAGDPTDRYFTNIQWSPDSKYIYMIELNRDQNHSQLVRYRSNDGTRESVLIEETDSKYVEPMHPVRFLPWDASRFIYMSRQDGWMHLYLYDTTGKMLCPLTKGDYETIDFVGFDRIHKTAIYTSNEVHPLQCNTYCVDMQGNHRLLDNGKGWHTPTLSSSGAEFLDRFTSPDTALQIFRCSSFAVSKPQMLHEASDPWTDYVTPRITVGSMKAADGKTDLYYRMVLPVDFDPARKYPTIVYVYGGPHAHNIDASRHWAVRGWDVWMAQQGYVMFCLDNRGSEHRGREFEQVTFRQLGVEEMKDQLCGIEFLKSLPYVDADRIGVHGWSFGGYMVASLMTTYPDVFKVGVAGGPVVDWKYYEVMYGERYMDTPADNPEGYQITSLLNKARNLKGHLLVIYGGNDPVCVPQHTLSFIQACIDADTYPDLFTYPTAGHNMKGNERVHLHNRITQYFNDYLK